MYKLSIILICIVVISVFFNNTRRYNIEYFGLWGRFKSGISSVGKGVGKGAKKVYSKSKKTVKAAGSGIKGLAEEVKNLGGTVKKVKKKITAIGDVFESMFNVVDDGFGLLKNAVNMLIVIAQILFLIVDKMKKCSKGLFDTNLILKQQITQIHKELLAIKNKITNCMSLKYVYTNSYYSNCIASMFSYRISIKSYITRLTNILNNPSLFAQIESSKYGASKKYCNSKFSTSESKKFTYSRKCNQCFNLQGLLAKGHSQLLNVTTLISKSDELFNELGRLKKNIDEIV